MVVKEERWLGVSPLGVVSNVLAVDPLLIDDNPWQPRQHRDADARLLESIAVDGLLHIPIARETGGRYQMGVGHRRKDCMAKLAAGKDERWPHLGVLLDVRVFTDEQAVSWALAENTQREPLKVIEEIEAWQRALEVEGITQEGLARIVGKDRATIANGLRLLTLPRGALDLVNNETMPARSAHELLAMVDSPSDVKRMRLSPEQAAKRAEDGLKVIEGALAHAKRWQNYASGRMGAYLITAASDQKWVRLDRYDPPAFDVDVFAREHADTIWKIDGERWTSDAKAYGAADKKARAAAKPKPASAGGLAEEQATDPVLLAAAERLGKEWDWKKPNLDVVKAAGTRGEPPQQHVNGFYRLHADYSPIVDRSDCGTCTTGAAYVRHWSGTAKLACTNEACYEKHRDQGAAQWTAALRRAVDARDEQTRSVHDVLREQLATWPLDALQLVADGVVSGQAFDWASLDRTGWAAFAWQDKERVKPFAPAAVTELKRLLPTAEIVKNYMGPHLQVRATAQPVEDVEAETERLREIVSWALAYHRMAHVAWPDSGMLPTDDDPDNQGDQGATAAGDTCHPDCTCCAVNCESSPYAGPPVDPMTGGECHPDCGCCAVEHAGERA